MVRLSKGLVQVYTGDGKGKTTAAFGLALRASGAGLKVYVQQFIKKSSYSEIKALKRISNIMVEQCGRGCFIRGKPVNKDRVCAERGLKRTREIIISGKYDIVIMDEINVALKLGLIGTQAVIDTIIGKPFHVELVLTGRGFARSLYKYADLITDMKEIKHPYRKGVAARRGIES